MSKKNPMTPDAARRIQSSQDKGGRTDGFKGRAQRAAVRNSQGGSKTKR